MKDKILIAGGSGMIGRALYSYFYDAGFEPIILSRNQKLSQRADFIYWDPAQEVIHLDDSLHVKAIINLCGINIFERRWTIDYKKQLLESRTLPIRFLNKLINDKKLITMQFLSISGSAIYGNHAAEWCTENDVLTNTEFITDLCQQWEQEVLGMQGDLPKTILRCGLVLSADGGALDPYRAMLPIRMEPVFGKGKSYVPWIHIQDLAVAFQYLIEHQLSGTYNITGEPVTSREFARAFLKANEKKGFSRRIPNFILNILLGERAVMLRYSQRMNNKKLIDAGFHLQFPEIFDALKNLKK